VKSTREVFLKNKRSELQDIYRDLKTTATVQTKNTVLLISWGPTKKSDLQMIKNIQPFSHRVLQEQTFVKSE